MQHDPPGRMLTCAAALAIAALGPAAGTARAGQTWTYSIAAGASVGYQYRVDPYGLGDRLESNLESFGPGLSLSASGSRALTQHTSLVIEGGYRSYDKAFGLVGIPELPPTTSSLRAEYFTLGAGLRIEGARSAGPYMQILPALFVSRWEEATVDHEGYDMQTGAWRQPTTHTDSFRSALPGIELSAGFRAPITSVIGTDIGLRWTRSADLGEHALGRFSSGDFRGLDEVALMAGLTWSP